jgi:hypothetical protein
MWSNPGLSSAEDGEKLLQVASEAAIGKFKKFLDANVIE